MENDATYGTQEVKDTENDRNCSWDLSGVFRLKLNMNIN